jgi:hypothetical protein
MLKLMNVVRQGVVIAALVASGAVAGTALARHDAPQTPKSQDKVELGQGQVKQAVLIVGTYKNAATNQENANVEKAGVSNSAPAGSRAATFAFVGK